MTKINHKIEINLWGSHPDNNNDDCWCGVTVNSTAEAQAIVLNPALAFSPSALRGTRFAEVVAPDGRHVVALIGYCTPGDDDTQWHREVAHQAGMAGGCGAYNDANGY